MAWGRFRRWGGRARGYAQRAHIAYTSNRYLRSRKWSRGPLSATFNPTYLAGFAVGMGLGRNYIPGIAQTALMGYSVVPVGVRGFGMVKQFSKGFTLGVILSGATGINLGGIIGSGGSANGPWV